MSDARWYPTNITLANGDELVVSGEVNSTIGHNPMSGAVDVKHFADKWLMTQFASLLDRLKATQPSEGPLDSAATEGAASLAARFYEGGREPMQIGRRQRPWDRRRRDNS